MKKSDLFTVLLPYLTSYRLNRWFGYKNFNPMTLTYSVTAACQSRCKTCQIGEMFCQDPSRKNRDLKLAEVRHLCDKHNVDVEKMKKWYDGYSFAGVGSVYNPNSVMKAIDNEDFDSYWTETSAAENLMDYITKDFSGLSKTIAELIAGIDVPVDTNGFANDLTTFRNSDDVLTLMIHLGYVAYDTEKRTVHITNEEIRRVFTKKRFNVSCSCD